MSAPKITELSSEDQTWLQRAEAHILATMRTKYCVEGLSRREADLSLLQQLIDDRAIAASDVLLAQCIGVALGNVFVEEVGMRWTRVANEFGDMIALYDDRSRLTYYPLTMISKRLQDGRSIDLVALYRDMAANVR